MLVNWLAHRPPRRPRVNISSIPTAAMSEALTTPKPAGTNQVAPVTPASTAPWPKGGYGLYPPTARKQLFEVAYAPDKDAVIDIERPNKVLRHGLPIKASCCCCFGGQWDEAYEFSAPVSNVWYKRLIRSIGFGPAPKYEGTMYDIVDELQRCQHISKIQSQHLYALVRTAMGFQYKAEKNIAKHRAGIFWGAVCAILVPVVAVLPAETTSGFGGYGVMVISLVQSLCLGIVIFANYVPKADLMRVHANHIKSEVYQYEALGGVYSNPPDYQTQYPRLMHNLSEFRHQTAIDEVPGRVKHKKGTPLENKSGGK